MVVYEGSGTFLSLNALFLSLAARLNIFVSAFVNSPLDFLVRFVTPPLFGIVAMILDARETPASKRWARRLSLLFTVAEGLGGGGRSERSASEAEVVRDSVERVRHCDRQA